jgi:hypothetical protein
MPTISKDGVLVEVTQEYLNACQVASPIKPEHIRVERDNLIAATDWWATSDRTMTAEQTAYRQALRDITDQAGFPTDITWPTKPE